MATHSSVLAWRIPWTEEPGGLQSMGSQESDTAEATDHKPFFIECFWFLVKCQPTVYASFILLSIHFMPCTTLNNFHVLSHLIITPF